MCESSVRVKLEEQQQQQQQQQPPSPSPTGRPSVLGNRGGSFFGAKELAQLPASSSRPLARI
ncbi:hypothetical protein TWF696_007125 [Orbilia brochopaga]|uniref:Uncharacterized protein n=1 Tax=Orbilia brochopaga TaxID=3140254 RepID=A0AAV9UV75_9PEZI